MSFDSSISEYPGHQYIQIAPGVNGIKLRISILQIFSPYFRKMENESLDKILKYGEKSIK